MGCCKTSEKFVTTHFLRFSCKKLQADCFAGAFADASTAFDAFFFIDLGDAVHDFDCFDRAGSDADAATGALAVVNFSSHFQFLLKDFQVVSVR